MNTILNYVVSTIFSILKKKYATLFLCYNACNEGKEIYMNPKVKLLEYATESVKKENILNTLYQIAYNGIVLYLALIF